MAYDVRTLPWEALIGPAVRATEAVARLDERLARSPVRDGWIERTHFHDAAAALWLEGELVHVEDLVLHDARMDVRAPTHELTRAHAVLRARRQILANRPDWALGRDGLRQLTLRGTGEGGGREGVAARMAADGTTPRAEGNGPGRAAARAPGSAEKDAGPAATDEEGDAAPSGSGDADDLLASEFAAIDAVLARSSRVLAGGDMPARPAVTSTGTAEEGRGRHGPAGELGIYDPDWDEEARLAEWRDALDATRHLPPVLRAALLLDAWQEIAVLQHAPWMGPLLVAALLRQEGPAGSHLACLHLGARNVPRERRRSRSRTERLAGWLDAVGEAAALGQKEHDRLVLARTQMERALRGRRSSSKLPGLVDLVLARPMVSTGMMQAALKLSKQGALNLVAELGLREITGRGRYRAWGIV